MSTNIAECNHLILLLGVAERGTTFVWRGPLELPSVRTAPITKQ